MTFEKKEGLIISGYYGLYGYGIYRWWFNNV